MLIADIQKIVNPIDRFFAFVCERENIRFLKEEGKPQPWTKDPILREWRFCNVHREDDRVTRWITDNWRTPHKDDPNLWFALLLARFVNWPDTLGEIGWPVPWDGGKRFKRVMADRRRRGEKVYSGAYMIRASSGEPGLSKPDYQVRDVFDPMWAQRETLRPKPGDTLNSYHVLLGQFHGLGSFMAAQVVADLKYVQPLSSASDWMTFAASGPGSRRGLNRILGRPVKNPWTEEGWRLELGRLIERVTLMFDRYVMQRLHAQDVQNCLCEWDKYERVRLGEGQPRARYHYHGD